MFKGLSQLRDLNKPKRSRRALELMSFFPNLRSVIFARTHSQSGELFFGLDQKRLQRSAYAIHIDFLDQRVKHRPVENRPQIAHGSCPWSHHWKIVMRDG